MRKLNLILSVLMLIMVMVLVVPSAFSQTGDPCNLKKEARDEKDNSDYHLVSGLLCFGPMFDRGSRTSAFAGIRDLCILYTTILELRW